MYCRSRPQYRSDLGWIPGVAFLGTLTRSARPVQGFTFVRCCSMPPASSPHGLAAPGLGVTGGAFPRKVGGENRTVTAGRRPWWPRMAGLQPLSTRAFGPRLRRLTALTALATRPLIATKRSTARCGQSVCKCHAEKFRSAIFARILTAVHTWASHDGDPCMQLPSARGCYQLAPQRTSTSNPVPMPGTPSPAPAARRCAALGLDRSRDRANPPAMPQIPPQQCAPG